ncbi:unnamed protein product [Lymnaea stagnalis]|uniref:EF-hand domain-containing protein n=1 Tax=Lymnaea stagnalis TaxID=6523 RepID=A0AAV2HZV7_LYMST
MHWAVIVVLVSLAHISTQQPPGVPPHKQNQPPQGHHHEAQQQQQHQQQQPPPNLAGGHGHGHGNTLEFASEVHNADHILEHLEKVVATKSKEQMTEEELEFHYFKLHDYDNNNKLDGVEIGKALTHFHDGDNDVADSSQERPYSDDEMESIIDSALRSEDLNNDGYVEYPEFMTAQARMRHAQGKINPESLPGYEGAQPPGHTQGGRPQPPGFQ